MRPLLIGVSAGALVWGFYAVYVASAAVMEIGRGLHALRVTAETVRGLQ